MWLRGELPLVRSKRSASMSEGTEVVDVGGVPVEVRRRGTRLQ